MTRDRHSAIEAVLRRHLDADTVAAAVEGGLLPDLLAELRRQGWSQYPLQLHPSEQLGVVILSAGGEVRVPASVRREVADHGVSVSTVPVLGSPDTVVVRAEVSTGADARRAG